MTASVSMSVFHQWLLADPASTSSAHAIILHMPPHRPCDLLIREIADHLNEYDDDGEGRWLPASPDLVEKISTDSNHRRLLGLGDANAASSAETDAEICNTLRALARRGHVVLRFPDSTVHLPDCGRTFHAGVGRSTDIPGDCHLLLNPDLMGRSCIAHVIGDVFLEWLHSQSHRQETDHALR